MMKWKFMLWAIIILEVGLKGKDVMLSKMHKEGVRCYKIPLPQTFNEETVKNAINHNAAYPPSCNFVQKHAPTQLILIKICSIHPPGCSTGCTFVTVNS